MGDGPLDLSQFGGSVVSSPTQTTAQQPAVQTPPPSVPTAPAASSAAPLKSTPAVSPEGPLDLSQFGGSVVNGSNTASTPAEKPVPNPQAQAQPGAVRRGIQTPYDVDLQNRINAGIGRSVGDTAGQLYNTAKQAVAPDAPRDHKEAMALFWGGPEGLNIYRVARGIVNSGENMLKAPKENFDLARKDFQRGLQEVQKHDFRNAAATAGSTVADLEGSIPGQINDFVSKRVRELTEGSRPGQDLAGPLAKDLTDFITMLVAEKTPEIAPEKIGQAADAVSTINQKARDIASNIKEAVTPETPLEKSTATMKRGVTPAGLKVEEEQDFNDMMGSLERHLPQYAKKTPIKAGPGGALAAKNMVRQAAQNLWDEVVQPVVDNHQGLKTSVENVGAAARKAATSANSDIENAAIAKYADRFDQGPWTVRQIADEIHELNQSKAIGKFMDAPAQDQASMLGADPALRGKVAALRALKETLFDKVADEVGESEAAKFQQARRDWGNLNDAEDWIGNARVPNPTPMATRVMNSIRGLIGLKSPEVVARSVQTLRDAENPNKLIPKAINQLSKTKVTPPAAVGRTEPFTPANRALPPVGATTTGTVIPGGISGEAPTAVATPTAATQRFGVERPVVTETRGAAETGAENAIGGVTRPRVIEEGESVTPGGKLARVPGRGYSPSPTINLGQGLSPEPAAGTGPSSRAGEMLDRLAAERAAQQKIIDDPMSSAVDKAIARGIMDRLETTNIPTTIPPLAKGFVRVRDSAGAIHDIPRNVIAAAIRRDPGIRIVDMK